MIQTPNAVACRGLACQYEFGELGVFSMQMGRGAMPLVKQYVRLLSTELGKKLLWAFVPENSNLISGRKRPKNVLEETLKKGVSKANALTTSVAAASSERVNARAYT